MKTNRLLFGMMAALLTTGCTRSEGQCEIELPQLEVNASILPSAMTTDKTAFEAGDTFSLYAWTGEGFEAAQANTPYINNAPLTYNGDMWQTTPILEWQDLKTPHYFVGSYPLLAIENFKNHTYPLTGDPATDDLLFAINKQGLTGALKQPVGLYFSHAMSTLNVSITFEGTLATNTSITSVTLQANTIASVDFLEQLTTPSSTGAIGTVTLPAITANALYGAIVVPQQLDPLTIQVIYNGKTYTYTHPTPFTFKQNNIHTIALVIDGDAISLESVTVTPWGDGTDFPGGEIG